MKTLFDPDVRAELIGRIRRLTPTAQRQWGALTAAAALNHMADELRLAFGDIQPTSPGRKLARWPFNYLAIYVIPWPKGRGKASPESFTTRPTSWAADQEALVALVGRFAEADPSAAWPVSTVFGSLSGADWGALSYKHLDHHLRQFAC